MRGFLCLLLHAHLPFVRHPEHERSLEEQWLFEAITETYLPLIQLLDAWARDGINPRLTLTLSPTLCAMLLDPLLRQRYRRHVENLIELAEKEVHRTQLQPSFQELARFYLDRFNRARDLYLACGGDLVGKFRKHQDLGNIEVITCAATHAVLPLLQDPAAIRAQIFVGCEDYRRRFGRNPRGIWLPECAYTDGLESVLHDAGLRWFVVDTHGILHARPRPRFRSFAPVFTPAGVAAFGRDYDSARQVWSRHEGYPGDPRYREFYRDIGFDLESDYLRPHRAVPEGRGFTGIKYHRITAREGGKAVYDRRAAMEAAAMHACHFLQTRADHLRRVAEIIKRPPVIMAPYDAELFGHWWFEGPDFLDSLVRQAGNFNDVLKLATPEEYLHEQPTQQVATPAPSSWGEEGYWRVWLNEKNEWIFRGLQAAHRRMGDLAARFTQPDPLEHRALTQAVRELLLAQASDWPFILRTGTSPGYAEKRVKDHLGRFNDLAAQLLAGKVDETRLSAWEQLDNLFPELDWCLWSAK
jgi:1,4-alpha-glucan branching enzyme